MLDIQGAVFNLPPLMDFGCPLGYHTIALLFRISALAADISALISSKESSRSMLLSAAFLCCSNKSKALGEELLMVKGMLRLLMTAFTKMLNAVLALMPNCSQSASNCDFISESNLTVTADCAIILPLFDVDVNATCCHLDGKITIKCLCFQIFLYKKL